MTRERTVRSTRCKLKGSIARMRMRKGAGSREVEGGRVEKGRREERCSPIDAAIGGKTLWGGGAPERFECHRRGQQLAQHDRSRRADALVLQVELRDAVLAQGDERDPAEVGHAGVLEHHHGQILRGVARDVVVCNAASPGHAAMV